MNDTVASPLNFIPIGRSVVDPVEISTAVSMAIFDRPSTDTHAYEDSNGRVVLRIFNIRTGQYDNFRPEDDHGPAQEYAIALAHGGAVLTKALQEGRLEAFVIEGERGYLRVPRLYWLKVNVASLTALDQTGYIPANLAGLPLLVDPDHLPRWREIAAPEIASMLQRTRAAAGVAVQKPKARTAKQGRNKSRTREIDSQIFDMFRRSHDRLANMTDEGRAAEIERLWGGQTKAPSKNTVARRWNEWLEKRANEARQPKGA